MPKFVKGHKFGGRPKGSKPRSWLQIEYWFNRLNAEYYQLKPIEKAKISLEVMKVLVNKLQTLPKEASDSVANASATMDLIKALEGHGKAIPVDSNAGSQLQTEEQKVTVDVSNPVISTTEDSDASIALPQDLPVVDPPLDLPPASV